MAASETYNIDHVANEIRRLRSSGATHVCLLDCTVEGLDSQPPAGSAAHTSLLRKAARLFLICLRTNDFVVRIADNRFAVLLSNADQAAGYRVCQRLWEQTTLLNLESEPPLLSLGVEVYSGPPLARRLCRHLTQSPRSRGPSAIEGPVTSSLPRGAGVDRGAEYRR